MNMNPENNQSLRKNSDRALEEAECQGLIDYGVSEALLNRIVDDEYERIKALKLELDQGTDTLDITVDLPK